MSDILSGDKIVFLPMNNADFSDFHVLSISDLSLTTSQVTISNTQSKFGGYSAYFPGSTSQFIQTSASSDLVLRTNPFTIEFWYYPVSKSYAYPYIFIIGNQNNFTPGTIVLNDRHGSYPTVFTFWVYEYSAGIPMLASTTTVQNNTWHHIEINRNASNVFRLFINGVLESSCTWNGNVNSISPAKIRLGTDDLYTSVSPINGYIDDFRLTIGRARHESNFSVPTQQSDQYLEISTNHICSLNKIYGKGYWAHDNIIRSNCLDKIFNKKIIWTGAAYGGTGKISDVLTAGGVNASRQVYLLEYPSFRVLDTTWSDPNTGIYTFNNLPTGGYYYVVGVDYTETYQPDTLIKVQAA